jgi:hypothetical protein
MTTDTELRQVMRQLVAARAALADKVAEADKAKANRDQTPEGRLVAALEAEAKLSRQQADALEDMARETALAHFREHQQAHPAPGVQVIKQTKITYQPTDLIAWCQKYAPIYVKTEITLDKTAFDKVAEVLPGDPPITLEPIYATRIMPKEFGAYADDSPALAPNGEGG